MATLPKQRFGVQQVTCAACHFSGPIGCAEKYKNPDGTEVWLHRFDEARSYCRSVQATMPGRNEARRAFKLPDPPQFSDVQLTA